MPVIAICRSLAINYLLLDVNIALKYIFASITTDCPGPHPRHVRLVPLDCARVVPAACQPRPAQPVHVARAAAHLARTAETHAATRAHHVAVRTLQSLKILFLYKYMILHLGGSGQRPVAPHEAAPGGRTQPPHRARPRGGRGHCDCGQNGPE